MAQAEQLDHPVLPPQPTQGQVVVARSAASWMARSEVTGAETIVDHHRQPGGDRP